MSCASLGMVAALAIGASQPGNDAPKLPFEKYVLPNGLTVILHQDNTLPLVAVSVWYDVGGISEKTGKTGFAHLFEHMMFQGTPHTGADMHFRRLQEVGATNINGTTELDRTNYFETVPSHQLELALWLESDRMGFLLHALTKPALDNQIEVVKNERRQSVENAPYGLLEERVMQTIYPPVHPYYGNVIGSMADLTLASVNDVRDFFQTYYTPANASLAVAGDIDVAKTKALIEKYFGTIHGRPKPQVQIPPAPVIPQETVATYEEPVANLRKLEMVWMTPSAFQPDTAELELLSHVISGTRSARLDKKVTYEDVIAQSVTAHIQAAKSGSLFSIEMTLQPGKKNEQAHRAVDAVLDDLRAHPPTKIELQRALNAFEAHLFEGLEILGGFSGRAERLQAYQNYLGDPGKLAWDIERYRKVTTKDLERVLKKYLVNDHRLVIYATPKKMAEGAE